MTRLGIILAAAVAMVATQVDAQEKEKSKVKTAFLSPADAGPDFAVQGEYVGNVGDAKYGAQVIARGDGKFEAFLLKGGLPGAGWDGKTRLKVAGETKGGATDLKGEDASGVILQDILTAVVDGGQGDLKKIHRQSPTLGMRPPTGATALFDGTNVDAWEPGKMAEDMLMGVGTRTNRSSTASRCISNSARRTCRMRPARSPRQQRPVLSGPVRMPDPGFVRPGRIGQ